jgi:hypothetical protein
VNEIKTIVEEIMHNEALLDRASRDILGTPYGEYTNRLRTVQGYFIGVHFGANNRSEDETAQNTKKPVKDFADVPLRTSTLFKITLIRDPEFGDTYLVCRDALSGGGDLAFPSRLHFIARARQESEQISKFRWEHYAVPDETADWKVVSSYGVGEDAWALRGELWAYGSGHRFKNSKKILDVEKITAPVLDPGNSYNYPYLEDWERDVKALQKEGWNRLTINP